MLRGLTIIMLLLFCGESISLLLNLPIPGNVLGMMLMFLALKLKIISLPDVEKTADSLLRYLALFFVPPGVGIIIFWDMFKAQWLAIVVSVVLSTIIVLASVALTYEKMEKN